MLPPPLFGFCRGAVTALTVAIADAFRVPIHESSLADFARQPKLQGE
jgi:hypothetical protein